MNKDDTYESGSVIIAGCNLIGLPDVSSGGAMSKAVSTEEMTANSNSIAIICPGHCLSIMVRGHMMIWIITQM